MHFYYSTFNINRCRQPHTVYTHKTDSLAFVMAIKDVCFKHTLLIKSQLKCLRWGEMSRRVRRGKNVEGVNVRKGGR